MIISVKREKGTIRLNIDFCSAVTEFAEVIEDDKLGVPYMAYVAYVVDLAEDNLFAMLPDDIRKKEVADSLKLDSDLLKDKKVLAALKRYKQFVDANIGYQFKEAHNNGMKKIAEYVKAVKGLTSEDAKEFASVLKEMPTILKGKGEIEKMQSKDAVNGIVRGKKQLTLNER